MNCLIQKIMINCSIIIPVYNTPINFVKDAIKTSLNQIGDVNIEVVLVDDKSTNDWYNQIDLSDSRITLYKLKKNMGVAYAWDYGIKKSKYDLICLLAADDFFHPDKIETQYAFMDAAKKRASYTGFITYGLDDNNKIQHITNHIPPHFIVKEDLFRALKQNDYFSCFINGASVMFEKSFYNEVGGFDSRLRYMQDYDLWLRMTDKELMVDVPLTLISRRDHNQQTKHQFQNDKQLNEIRRKSIEYAIIKLKWERSEERRVGKECRSRWSPYH